VVTNDGKDRERGSEGKAEGGEIEEERWKKREREKCP
jgi:hypothetical protein